MLFIGFKIFQFFDKKELEFNLNQSAIVQEIQSLNRLETASFTIEKIIEAGTNNNAFSDVLFGDKILLIAHANIIAGFDFSRITKDDVDVKGKILTINMPAPEILISKLDNEKTVVYDRKLGLFTKGDSKLESQARLIAENSIRGAACEAGILESATVSARKQLTVIFLSAGFEQVVLNIPSGDCN